MYNSDHGLQMKSGLYVRIALLALFMFLTATGTALALPRDPIFPDPLPGEEPEPYTPPDNGFAWSVPSRFGLFGPDGMIDFHWWAGDARYDPTYVHPSQFPVFFDGCQTAQEEATGISTNTFTWTIAGQTTSGHACRFQRPFDAQGSYNVALRITGPNGAVVLDSQGRGDPFTQTVVVKDLLVVSLGDSYASGEGSPDRPQILGNPDIFGQPTAIVSPVRWQDRRCHRSANSAPAQAARMLERADPHTSVTFLSFACSGATINTNFYKEASNYDPYRDPQPGWTKLVGSGLLGPYAGKEPPNPDRPQDDQLPSQIDQLRNALTNNGQVAARPVDALLISVGGNDIGFGSIAQLCILYGNCMDHFVTDARGWGLVRLRVRVDYDLSLLPGKYAALATAINQNVTFTPGGRVYITQYPDSTRNDQGDFCNVMAADLIPSELQGLLQAGALLDGAPLPFPPFMIAGNEVIWAGGDVVAGLNARVGTAAAANGWVLVDGIADASANLFSGHGYCATDNWIRRAPEAVLIQGPWGPWYQPVIYPYTTQTQGTLHPTTRGYQVVAERIFAKMAPNLLPMPPQDPPAPPAFASTTNNSTTGANGWLTGKDAGVTCPGSAANCAFAQVTATTAPSTAIQGASLRINGAQAACSASGTTAGGVTCRTQLVTPQSYRWELSFAADGIYSLEFAAGTREGVVGTFGHEVRVDLNNPVATHSPSAALPASGWYQTPVSVTVSAADGNGSGIQSIEYLAGGASTSVGGNNVAIDLETDGVHSISYRASDRAGRTGAWQSLTVQIDQTPPQSAAQAAPAGNAAGWHRDNEVSVTLSTGDNGGSGVASFTYSAAGAQTLATTSVPSGDPIELTVTAEGETTISFFAEDVAGNVEPEQTFIVRIDRTSPAVTCAAADGQWHGADVSIACAGSDAGSGLQQAGDASFALTTSVPAGTETSAAQTDSRQICDAAGNCAIAGPVGGNRVDKKAPTIDIASPAGTYLLNEVVSASYSCADGGSGLASCAGPVSSGGTADTGSPGNKTFSVQATDNVGNVATVSTSYSVSYRLCLLYDQTKAYRRGSVVPLRLQLCDAGSVNVSAAGIVVHALGLTRIDSTATGDLADAGNANPDNDFRFDPELGGYVYNLSSKGLGTGTWALSFSISGDPLTHRIEFNLR